MAAKKNIAEAAAHVVKQEFSKYTVPVFVKEKRDKFVKYGEDNCYPQYLVELFNKSAKHNAIVTAKQTYIYGQGLTVKQETPEADAVKLKAFIATANKFEGLNDIFKKIDLDLEVYGGFALQIIWNRAGTQIAEIYHTDFCNWRSNELNTEFYFSNDWKSFNAKFATYHAFNPDKPKGTQVFYFKQYRPNTNTYPLPEYIGAVPYIECDTEIANFHRANLQNSFWGGNLISFNNGIPTPEEQREIVKKLERKHTGTDNAGRTVVNFAESKDKEPTIHSLVPSDLDKQFQALNDQVQEEIFIAHKITSPLLFGVKTEGQLGNARELLDAYSLFDQNYITPKQNLFERIFNYLASINGMPGAIEVKKLEMFKPHLTEETLVKALTVNELRKLLAYEESQDPKANTPTVLLETQSEAMPPKVPPSPPAQFSAQEDDDLIQMFSQCGEDAESYEVLRTRKVTFADADGQEDQYFENIEQDVKNDYRFADAEALSGDEKSVVDAMKENPIGSIAAIAAAAGLTAAAVNAIVKDLTNRGVIGKTEGAWNVKIDALSKSETDRLNEELSRLEVKYKYNGPRDSRNRAFCAALLELNRVYTRKEIDSISGKVGYSVWDKRGGWYHNPKNDVNTPYCRHNWNAVLVRKK